MTSRMLIDARHREETRVAVVQGNRIEEFDFESAERKQLKGNIYLAKVTRVEPSLQAAFIDYGGNRHGFLAFSEIHPDYYQIPKEDRDALLREEAEHAAEEAALRARQDAEDDGDDEDDDDYDDDRREEIASIGGDDNDDADETVADEEGTSGKPRGNDEVEALRQRRMNLRRRYKIQDVIHRRQVLLVQVVKEERGNKGAALTTYLSLAGRYCVLMPNTSHGGGISRKIRTAGDRKRLKSLMADLALPPSMGCIVRTAGLQRTRTEIKRDFDYLARLWDGIRETTLKSAAPAVIYGDSDLIKRAIRDIYNKDVDEVIVEGEEGYRHAKEFMRLLMPTHARRVKQYADAVPLFQRARVEDQLAAMYNPVVQLKSGGYLVINPTEALVSIDINSGRSTREHNIEQTATATNLEAAAEIARQLRLRDMAGLVVIDFIDMDNGSNVRKVEKAMKEALKNDRARIQVGRISSFGLMEMSRQRLRTGVLEASTRPCPHCEGVGLVRTGASSGLSALRLIEDEAARGHGSCLTLRASQEAAIYVLNRKRADIAEIEDRYGVQVEVLPGREEEGARMSVEASGPPPAHPPRLEALVVDEDDDLDEEIEAEDEEEIEAASDNEDERGDDDGRESGRDGGRKRRRRRRGRGRRDEEGGDQTPTEAATDEASGGVEADAEDADEQTGDQADEAEFVGAAPVEGEADPQEGGSGRRRRGRRSRRRRGGGGGEAVEAGAGEDVEVDTAVDEPVAAGDQAGEATEEADAADAGPVTTPLELAIAADEAANPKPRRRRRTASAPVEASTDAPAEATGEPVAAANVDDGEEAAAPAKPRRSRRKAPAAEAGAATDETAAAEEPVDAPAKPRRTRRRATTSDAEPIGEASAPELAPELPIAPVDDAVPLFGQDGTEDRAADATVPATDDEAAPAGSDAAESPRRGWWQRTFGA